MRRSCRFSDTLRSGRFSCLRPRLQVRKRPGPATGDKKPPETAISPPQRNSTGKPVRPHPPRNRKPNRKERCTARNETAPAGPYDRIRPETRNRTAPGRAKATCFDRYDQTAALCQLAAFESDRIEQLVLGDRKMRDDFRRPASRTFYFSLPEGHLRVVTSITPLRASSPYFSTATAPLKTFMRRIFSCPSAVMAARSAFCPSM